VKLELSEIKITDQIVQIKYVKHKMAHLRLSSKDDEKNGILYKAYQLIDSRIIFSFYWDFKQNYAFISISQGKDSRNSTYHSEKNALIELIKNEIGIDLDGFELVKVHLAIKKIEVLSTTRNREIGTKSKGGIASYRAVSSSKSKGIESDRNHHNVRNVLDKYTRREEGNFYWESNKISILSKDMRTKIYKIDQRVAIYGEFTIGEVLYVVERINTNSK
jgi:hypothetical protein